MPEEQVSAAESSWIVADESAPELLVPEPLFADGPSSVSIPGFERVEGVEFFRVCVSSAPYTYEVRRRFSQFEGLARSMETATLRKHPLPTKYLGRHTDANVEARAHALESWLHAVLSDMSCAHDVQLYLRPFLELDAAKALSEQHETARANQALEKLDASVHTTPTLASEKVPVSAERRKLLEELSEKDSQVRRLEKGMSTAKALISTMRSQLLEAEKKQGAPNGEGAPADAAAPGATEQGTAGATDAPATALPADPDTELQGAPAALVAEEAPAEEAPAKAQQPLTEQAQLSAQPSDGAAGAKPVLPAKPAAATKAKGGAASKTAKKRGASKRTNSAAVAVR